MSPNPWSDRETELRRWHTQSFINILEAQTQQQPTSQAEPDATEQGAQCESCHASIDTTPQVRHYRDDSEPRHCSHDVDDSDSMVYASFNLQNINASVPPKWKHNDHILEEYKKFCHSCQRIFDGQKSGTFRSQPSTKPVNSANNTVQCSSCSMTHLKKQCPAYQVACFKCNKIGHYATECRSSNSSSNSTQNTRQFTGFHGRGRTPHGRGFTPRRQTNEATEVPKAKSNEKSDLDIVRLMEAYGLSNNSPQTSLK